MKNITERTDIKNVAEYEDFLRENREKINRNLGVLMVVCIFFGPLMIAICIASGIYRSVSYSIVVIVMVFMIVLTVINKLMKKFHPTSYMTGFFSLMAIDILLYVVNGMGVPVNVTWFLVPLLSIRYCDYIAYFVVLVMNYVFYLSAMWYSTGLEILPKTGSRYEIYIERVASGTIGLAIMAICGFFLCRMMREYYRGMIDRYVEANKTLSCPGI